MKLALQRRGEYPEPIRAELEQLVAAITTSDSVEHDAEGRQRQTCGRWNLGADQSLATATFTRIVNTRPEADNAGLFSMGTDGILVIQVPGTYLVQAQIRYEANATGLRGGQLRRNRRVMAFALGPVHAGAQVWVNVAETFPCVAGTTIELEGLQTSGGALSILAATAGADHHTFLRVTRVA